MQGEHARITRDVATPPQYPWVNHCRFYAVNGLELLDSPGEYFVSAKGILFFLPPDDTDPTSDIDGAAVVSVLSDVLAVTNVKYVSFTNMTISDAQTTTVKVSGSANISFVNSTVSNSGGECISFAAAD